MSWPEGGIGEMSTSGLKERFRELFNAEVEVDGNYVVSLDGSSSLDQQQTNEAFSDKWETYSSSEEREGLYLSLIHI